MKPVAPLSALVLSLLLPLHAQQPEARTDRAALQSLLDGPRDIDRGQRSERGDLPAWRIGVGVAPIDPVLRAHLRLPAEGGLRVMSVEEFSPAEKAGLREHDLILEVNGRAPESLEQLRSLVVEAGRERDPLELLVMREGKREKLQVRPQGAAPEKKDASGAATPWSGRSLTRMTGAEQRMARQLAEIIEQLERQTDLLEKIADHTRDPRRRVFPSR